MLSQELKKTESSRLMPGRVLQILKLLPQSGPNSDTIAVAI